MLLELLSCPQSCIVLQERHFNLILAAYGNEYRYHEADNAGF